MFLLSAGPFCAAEVHVRLLLSLQKLIATEGTSVIRDDPKVMKNASILLIPCFHTCEWGELP